MTKNKKENLAKRRKLKAEALHDQARQDTCVETAARESSLSKALMPEEMKSTHVHDLAASSGSTKIGKPMAREEASQSKEEAQGRRSESAAGEGRRITSTRETFQPTRVSRRVTSHRDVDASINRLLRRS